MPDQTSSSGEQEAAAKLISLAEAAEMSGLSAGHLRLLVSQNKLWGTKIGRNWVTTEKSVRDYMATDPRPGPKPKGKSE